MLLIWFEQIIVGTAEVSIRSSKQCGLWGLNPSRRNQLRTWSINTFDIFVKILSPSVPRSASQLQLPLHAVASISFMINQTLLQAQLHQSFLQLRVPWALKLWEALFNIGDCDEKSSSARFVIIFHAGDGIKFALKRFFQAFPCAGFYGINSKCLCSRRLGFVAWSEMLIGSS